jgi:hypothetical protein
LAKEKGEDHHTARSPKETLDEMKYISDLIRDVSRFNPSDLNYIISSIYLSNI